MSFVLRCALVSFGLFSASPALAQLRFKDVAAERGLDFEVRPSHTFLSPEDGAYMNLMQLTMGTGAAVGDYDNDGDLDVYLLAHVGEPNRLFRNELMETGEARFSDVTEPPLDNLGLSRVAHFVDLDNDGFLDLLLLNDDASTGEKDETQMVRFRDLGKRNQRGTRPDFDAGVDGGEDESRYGSRPSRVFRNEGDGTFRDVSGTSNFRPRGMLRCGMSLADYSGDGLLDVYVTNWGGNDQNGPFFHGQNLLYRSEGPFVFSDRTPWAGVGNVAWDSYTTIFTDFDEDGYKDLYIAVDHFEDLFFKGEHQRFSYEADQVGTLHVGNDMGATAADFDDDGDLDIYTTNITDVDGFFGTHQGNVLYVNQLSQTGRLSFLNQAQEHGVRNTLWGWGTSFFDPDNDGDLDLVAVGGFDDFVEFRDRTQSTVYKAPSSLLENDGAGRYAQVKGTDFDFRDNSRALVVFDYDRDGDQDVLVTNHNQPVRLFENQTLNKAHYLTVHLVGDAAAAGAQVWATFGQFTKRRDVLIGDSYLAGTPREAHFGLGAATKVDKLRVKWADGRVSLFEDVAADQLLELQPPRLSGTTDAGLPDGSLMDAGVSGPGATLELDASVASDDEAKFATDVRPVGGCACRVAHPSAPIAPDSWPGAVLGIGLLLQRRRRRITGAEHHS